MKHAIVTGANGGIGGAIVRQLLEKGFMVYGFDFGEPKIQHENYKMLNVDITSEESVKKAYCEITAETDSLDVIVNTAGICYMSTLAEDNTERLEKLVSVNLFGMYRVNQTFFDLVYKAKGRLINFSSEYGKYTSMPFNGFYGISKHAVEAYSDALRREIRHLGVKVITVRPGVFNTGMASNVNNDFDSVVSRSSYHKEYLKAFKKKMDLFTSTGKHPDVMAKAVVKAATSSHPKRVVKCNHTIAVKLFSTLPESIIDLFF